MGDFKSNVTMCREIRTGVWGQSLTFIVTQYMIKNVDYLEHDFFRLVLSSV